MRLRKGITKLILPFVLFFCSGFNVFAKDNLNLKSEMHTALHVLKNATSAYKGGYTPTQIKTAYGINNLTSTGIGQTIAIIDAYGSPTITSDLAYFNKQFNLPAADLTIAYPTGKVSQVNGGWALETALDVEWAHALAPGAKILLVVAKSAQLGDLLTAVDYAVKSGAQVVSMSWGSSEFTSESSYDFHFSSAGKVFLASSGDSGAGTLWPASSQNVVSVGGTTLKLDQNSNRVSETAWTGSGGGISKYVSEPSWQTNIGITNQTGMRGNPDVSFVADPNTGVAVYSSTKYNRTSGWFIVGGTSLSAPSWAALVALADQGRTSPISDGHSLLYNLAGGIAYSASQTSYFDITSGTNGGFSAGGGYDYVTGLGSPEADKLIPALAAN